MRFGFSAGFFLSFAERVILHEGVQVFSHDTLGRGYCLEGIARYLSTKLLGIIYWRYQEFLWACNICRIPTRVLMWKLRLGLGLGHKGSGEEDRNEFNGDFFLAPETKTRSLLYVIVDSLLCLTHDRKLK